MNITSRDEAITKLGEFGAKQWDQRTRRLNIGGVDYDFQYPPEKLKPLSDEDVWGIWSTHAGDALSCIRAVIQAHDKRRADIAAQETEGELIARMAKRSMDDDGIAWRDLVAMVREHYEAKKER